MTHKSPRLTLALLIAASLLISTGLFVALSGDDPAPTPNNQAEAQDNDAERPGRPLTPSGTRPPSSNTRSRQRAPAATSPTDRARPDDAKAPGVEGEFVSRLDEIAGWDLADYAKVADDEGWDEGMRQEFENWLMRPEHWDKTCSLARDVVSRSPRSEQTFEEIPEGASPGPVWLLRWHEVAVPIPAIQFTRLRVYRHNVTRKPTFFLYNPDMTVLIGLQPRAQIQGAFMKMPGDDSRALTQQLFDGPVSREELLTKGFQNTPEDISCEPGQWKKDAAIAVSLTYKGKGSPKVVYAIGEHPGWVSSRDAGGRRVWDARIFPMSLDEELTVAYSLTSGGLHDNIGALTGSLTEDTAPGRPTWIDALSVALTADTPEGWAALDDAMADGVMEQYQRTLK